jgi:hypothetical protein
MVSRGIGVYALVGLLPHSFFDGVAISAGFLESASLGTLIFIGILLHKVPTGVSLASIMLASGNTRRQTMVAVLRWPWPPYSAPSPRRSPSRWRTTAWPWPPASRSTWPRRT